jgi:general secretion pathway protein A
LLEEIRLLSNIEKDYTKLLNIFFVGQNEFNNIILEQRNRPLRQRITINYNIEPLEKHEVMEYIRYRLAVAGCETPLFTAEAVQDVYSFSEGYPRLINIICDHALLTAFVQGARQVDGPVVRECAGELRIKLVTPQSLAPPAVETLARAEAPAPVRPTTPPPAPPPPSKTSLPSSQTMLLIIFGLLCFIAGLLAFTLRERPKIATSGTESITVTDGAPEKLASSVSDAEAGTRDATPSSEKKTDLAQGDTASTPDEPTFSDAEQISAELSLDAEESELFGGAATESVGEASATDSSAEEEDGALDTAIVELSPDAEESEASAGATTASAGEASVSISAVDEEDGALGTAVDELSLPEKLIIYFKIDSNELDDNTLRELGKLAGAFKQKPHFPIRVTGYTDAAGNLHYNFKVSEFRANIVKTFLVGKGIDPQRIVARGLGPANPIASNETLAGRRINRRVEVELVKE